MLTYVTDNANTKPHFFFALADGIESCFITARPPRVDPDVVPGDCCQDCLVLPVTAVLNGSANELLNDFYTAVYTRGGPADTFDIVLQKFDGSWMDVETLDQASFLGTFYDFGDVSPDTTGFKLNWQSVLNDSNLGEGYYRIYTVGTGVASGVYITLPFCLKNYNQYLVNPTVRFDWKMQGEQCEINNYQLRSNYGTGYDMSLRLPGRFGQLKGAYENLDYNQYLGDIERNHVDITPTYIFRSGMYFFTIHEMLMFNAFPANELWVTDYSLNRQYDDIIKIPILLNGGYEPDYSNIRRRVFRVEVEFKHKNWQFGIGGKKC